MVYSSLLELTSATWTPREAVLNDGYVCVTILKLQNNHKSKGFSFNFGILRQGLMVLTVLELTL